MVIIISDRNFWFFFSGSGEVDVSGGAGRGNGGGGSGGRIAVYTNATSGFYGSYNILGGSATDDQVKPRGGGSGTAYLWEPKNGLPYDMLLIDNNNRLHSQFVMLDEGRDAYEFDEIHLPRKSSLHINASVPAEFVIHKVVGDRTGLLQSHAGQRFYVEVVKSVPTVSKTPVNFIIDRHSEMIFGPTLYVLGLGVPTDSGKIASMDIDGRFTNVEDITVNQYATVQFRANAHTAKLENGEYVKIGDAGNFTFGTIQLLTESNMYFTADLGLRFLVNDLHARYDSRISAEHIELLATSLNVEKGGLVTCSAGDRPEDTVSATEGQGLPATSQYSASGAGHANVGGNSYIDTSTIGATGGAYYGSIYKANERGSDGGTGPNGEPGGKGGGYMKITVGDTFRLDGELKLDGVSGASGSGSGGGSGGSLHLSADVLDGLGAITAHGGSGDGQASGGGSGGIITIFTTTNNHNQGSLDAHGGQGNPSNDDQASHGGPGSIFLHHLIEGYPYTKLFIDNQDRSWVHYFTLREDDTSDYYFNEIHMTNKASLHLLENNHHQKLVTPKLFGDLAGLVHIHKNQTHTYDVIEGEVTTMKLPVNLYLDPGGIAELATTVDVIGLGDPAFYWDGQLLGVRHLRVSPGRVVIIGADAHTALILDNEYVFLDDPGTFRFSSLEFGSQSAISIPPPLGATFTVGYLVSKKKTDLAYHKELGSTILSVPEWPLCLTSSSCYKNEISK